ncbi:hypothetical protein [Haloplanus halobius]|uniref:hypothetical protein n=1 Tax=Haloplanus halobius TaxID=2934938 RepID=UPI00200EE19D|nr:hypothetical protein [Haloplanus sp. XH21]
MNSARSLQRLARGAATVAGLVGAYHFLFLMGAFGPVSCWRSTSATGSAASNGTETTTTPTVTRGCESGIDALLGGAGGGNAQILFSWALVLLVLVAVGVYSSWTNRRRLTWGTVVAGAAITVVGVFSIGWYFLLPTLFLLLSATALSVDARRE